MNLRQTIRASPRFPKPAPNLDFLASLKKTTLQQFHILTQSFHTWEKRPSSTKIYARVSIGQSEGERMWGRIRSRTRFPMQICKGERKYTSGLCDCKIVQVSDVNLSSIF